MTNLRFGKLALCLLWLATYGLFFPVLSVASETTEIIKEASWDIGGAESYEGARARAKAKAEQDAVEAAGMYIESYARVQNYQLTADEVQMVSVAVLHVEVLDEEQRKTGKTSSAAWIKIKATVSTADIDTLRAKLKDKGTDEQLRQSLAETEKLKKILEDQNRILEELKGQLAQPQDEEARRKTLAAVTDNDRMAQALESLKEARRYILFLAYPEAEKALEQALMLKPDLADAYLTWGGLYLDQKEYVRAAIQYRQATSRGPGMKEAWFGLAVALAGQERYKEAAQAFNASVEYRPETLSFPPVELQPYEENGRWGFCYADRTPATTAHFDDADMFLDGLARVTFGSQAGYVSATRDADLVLIVDGRAKPQGFYGGLAIVLLGDKYGYMDKTGRMVIEPRFDWATSLYDNLACIQVKDKYGLMDNTGRLVVEPQYDSAMFFQEGLAAVAQSQKYGYLDTTGHLVIPLRFTQASDFSEGLAAVKLGGKFGYIDKTGNFVISPRYADAGYFHEGQARVTESSGWGFIDQNGRLTIPTRYSSAWQFVNGVAYVELNGEPTFIDKRGRITQASQEDTADFTDLQIFQVSQKYGYKDAQGQAVIPALYEGADAFSDGLAAVQIQGKWGYINKIGQFVIEPKYSFAGSFGEGLAPVVLDEKMGYIDQQGRQVIAPLFDMAGKFSDGLASVALFKDGTTKWGFIDHSGQIIIPIQFSDVGSFSEGLAAVQIEKNPVWIDKRGRIIKSAN